MNGFRYPSRVKKTFLMLSTAIYICQPALAMATPAANQLPTGGQVVGGQANISQNGANMQINQTTNRAAINWQSFDIGKDAAVNFEQPSANSVALNRVQNGDPSQIFGKLTANGQVFLTNAAGVYFAPGASVNVGALVATTHDIDDADFMAGNDKFDRNGSTGKVINDGEITVDIGKYVALLAPEVQNNGVIIAQMGTVALAAGESYELQFNGQGGLADIAVTKSNIDALVENKQLVRAPGGIVILSAQAVNSLQGGVVKNSGNIEAGGLVNDGGVVRLVASDAIELGGNINVDAKAGSSGKGGTVLAIASLENKDSTMEFSGKISAKGGDAGGDGGFVETSGSHVDIDENARVDTQAAKGETGEWLIDPYNYTIDASAATAIQTALGSSNVTVTTAADVAGHGSNGNNASAGNINVTSAINSGSAYELTLTAANAITVSAAISTGALTLNGPGGITLNNNLATITGMTLNGNVTLGADVTLTSGVSDTINSYTAYVVPNGVSSITATLIGAAGGEGGDDGSFQGGGAGNVGAVTASFAVTAGQTLYVAPGSAGTIGVDSAGNAAGGAGGTNQFNLGNGGAGGTAGPTGSSGSGGGGGAATVVSLVNAPNSSSALLVAGGGGGGGGSGNNAACPSLCGDQASASYRVDNSMTGQTGYNAGNQGSSINDGGSSGGGGGGVAGGLSNNSVFFVNEWTGRGGNVGSSGVANSFATTSLSTSTMLRSAGADGYAIISYGGGSVVIDGTINGGHALTVSAPSSNVSITGAIGGSSALTSLSVTGSQGISLAGGAVTTTGAQTYTGPLTLNVNNTSFSTTNNAVAFAGDILKGSSVNSNMTVSTGNGNVSFNGKVGTSSTSVGTIGVTTTGTTTIAGQMYATSLTKSGSGTTKISGGLVQTTGGQSYAGIVDLGGNTSLSSTGTGNITLSGAVSNSNQSNLTINAAGGNVSIAGNLAVGTNARPTPIGDVSITASGTVTLGSSGTPISVDAKSLSVTAGTANIYADTGTSFTCGTGSSATGICLTNSAIINVTNASTFSGPLSGTTSFTKSGAGNLSLTGVNTYTGNTTVNAGRVEVGGSGRIGNGNYNGNIVVNGQIRFNTSASNTINGTVSGTGFINTVGSGVTSITTQSNHNYYNLITAYAVPTSNVSGSSSLYGSAPTFGYQLATTAAGGTAVTDADASGTAVLSGAPTNTSNVGNYTVSYSSGITLGNERYLLAAGNNLAWAVAARPLTVTVSKVYDGAALFSSGFALSGMVNGDAAPALSGSASTLSVNAGSYSSFAASTLSQNNSNYTLTGATIAATITKKPLNVTVTKVYDATSTFSSGFEFSGMVGSESAPTATGSASTSGASFGDYTSFATDNLTLSNANYTTTGGNVTASISKRVLNISATKNYDGNNLFSRGFTLSNLASGDTAPGVSGTATISNPGAGTYTSFATSSLALDNANYTLDGGTISVVITPQPPVVSEIIVKPPVTTIPVFEPTSTPPLSFETNPGTTVPAISGGKTENVPVYEKLQTEQPTNTTTASKSESTTTSEPVTNQNTNTSSSSSAVTTSGVTVSLVQEPSGSASGVISVAVPKDTMQKSNGFTFALPEQIALPKGADISSLVIKTESGNPLPAWIKFNPENNSFVATNVPSGGLPISIVISKDGVKATIVISENQ